MMKDAGDLQRHNFKQLHAQVDGQRSSPTLVRSG